MTSPPSASDTNRVILAEVAKSPVYLKLVRERSRFAWTLTAIMLVIFFGYILVIAFAPELLARRIGEATTIGIPIGIGVIVAGILLTAIYVHRANRRFDPLIRDLIRSSGIE